MPLPRSVTALLLLLLLEGMLLGCGCTTQQPVGGAPANETITTLTFYTEQNPPFNYMENGTLQGISIDLFEAITAKMGQNVSRDRIRLVPWDEAYQAALTGNNSMIFAIARLPSREASFNWAGPMPPYVTVVFARSDSGIVIQTPEDLRRYRVGAVAEDAAVQQLLDAGVNGTRLVQTSNASALVDLALKGEIDLWADSEVAGQAAALEATGTTSTFGVVYTFPEIPIYYGFSRDVPDATVAAFQQALDALKSERDAAGLSTYDRIVQRSRATGLAPARLTFYTEQNPPFNYMENGTLKGIGVDLLEAVTGKMGQTVLRDQVHLVPWPEGYQAALTMNNSVLFTTVRLPAREQLFKWAGPIYPYTNAVFARQDSTISIAAPADLNRYRIGVVTDDIAGIQLRELGVDQSRLAQEANASVLVSKLRSGEIDLWAYQEAAGWYFARQETGDASTVKVVYTLPALDGYYVFNTGVPDATVTSFQQALDAIKTEKGAGGMTVYERIVQRNVPQRGSG